MSEAKTIILSSNEDIPKAIYAVSEINVVEPVRVRIDKYVESHTDQQRKTYWMWLDEIVAQGGGTGNRYGLDEDFRKRFLKPTTYTKINGSEGSYLKSVSQLDKNELSHLMSEVWVIAHEFGMTLKDPQGFMRK